MNFLRKLPIKTSGEIFDEFPNVLLKKLPMELPEEFLIEFLLELLDGFPTELLKTRGEYLVGTFCEIPEKPPGGCSKKNSGVFFERTTGRTFKKTFGKKT